jgi:uncharacterized protein (DUF934 family)
MKLIAANAHSTVAGGQNGIQISNDSDPRELNLQNVHRVDLHFPKFSDGRAFSQAFLLRCRLGFKGEIRATGDVLIDQLVQMRRSGFDAAVLREDQNPSYVQAQFDRFQAFYQGDAVTPRPNFNPTSNCFNFATGENL